MLIDGEEDRPPEIGDYSVCAYCGQILAYRTTTHVGAVGEDELADIDPHTATVLRSMSRRIKNHQAGKN